jgi:DNA-directed RNA polymerase subunit M/transcription elongation factor TFIIS
MPTTPTNTETWSDAPLVFRTADTCPECGSLKFTIIRSLPREADGSRARRCQCSRCFTRFVLVIEPPEPLPTFGKDELDVD